MLLLTCDLEPVRVLHGDVEGVDEVAGGKALVHTGRRRVHRDLGVGGLENAWRQSRTKPSAFAPLTRYQQWSPLVALPGTKRCMVNIELDPLVYLLSNQIIWETLLT